MQEGADLSLPPTSAQSLLPFGRCRAGSASGRFFVGANRTTGTSRLADPGRALAPDHGGQRGRSAGRSTGAVVPVPQIKEEVLERTPIFDMQEPQTTGNILQKRISDRTPIAGVQVPAILGTFPQERISERIHEQTVDQPGDQARRDPADSIHRQGCRHVCGEATTSPSDSDAVEGCGSPDQPGGRRPPGWGNWAPARTFTA